MSDYNENSIDAVLARMEERQKINGSKLDAVLDQHDKLNARVTCLEDFNKRICIYASVAATLATLLWQGAWEWLKGKP